MLFFTNLLWSRSRGPRATDNPWDATTLEWTTSSPAPPENFGVLPVVAHGPYEYSVPGARRDWIMQNDPPDAAPPVRRARTACRRRAARHPAEPSNRERMSESQILERPAGSDTIPPGRPGDRGRGGGDGEPPERPRRSVESVAVLGMWVALAPILMLFLAFVSAYIVRHGFGHDWVPEEMPPIVYWNTLVLLASSLVLERARRVDRAGGRARPWVVATLGLGSAFVGGQLLGWRQMSASGLDVAATPHSSFFYLLTGAHALHVAGGLLGLAIATAWPRQGWRGASLTVALHVTAIYWHFLGILYLGLLAVLRIWR
jgi:cytochrome c oxidase subunit 3